MQTKEALAKREECALVVSQALEMICHVREGRKKRQFVPRDQFDVLHPILPNTQHYKSAEEIGISSVGIEEIEKVILDLEKATSQDPSISDGK